MSEARAFDRQVTVSGQLGTDEVAGLAAQGFGMIINNRPDGEDADQPPGHEIEAAAEAAGIDYRSVPVARGLGPAQVDAMIHALEEAGDRKVFAYCRSGQRSALVTALARRRTGTSREEVEQGLASAGVDPIHIAHLL